jgi:acetyltransferase-like isoleucine patch superfamily enzyme
MPNRKILRQRTGNARRNIMGWAKSKLSGADSFGKRPVLMGRIVFQLGGRATFGERFGADGRLAAVSFFVAEDASLSIGDDAFVMAGASIEAWHEIRIGNNTLVASHVAIIDDDRHYVEPGSMKYKGPVVVGDNVWLGRNVAVMPGVTIGDGSVIGANSVVTRDIPPGVFAAGSPARVVRKLDLPDGWVRV